MFTFIVDTDKYSGNFEREMCAFVTGQVGECGVGDEYADSFEEEFGEDFTYKVGDMMEGVPDDHGCFRPVGISTAPDSDECASVEIYFGDKPDSEIVKMMKERAVFFGKTARGRVTDELYDITVLGFRLTETTTETVEHKMEGVE